MDLTSVGTLLKSSVECGDGLRKLADLADHPRSDRLTRARAMSGLAELLLRMKQIEADPRTTPEVRREIQGVRRGFLAS